MTEKIDIAAAEKISAIWSAVRKLRDAAKMAAGESPQNPYTRRAAEVLEQAAYLLAEASTLEDGWVADEMGDDDA